MSVDVRLGWVQRNRTRRTNEHRAGDILGALARRERLSANDAVLAVASTVARLVDREFMTHCRIASVSKGTMVVNVDAPALVYPMRMRWLDTLRTALCKRRTRTLVAAVVFQHGKTGVLVTDAE